MLNNIGIPGLILIAVVVLVLFGRGKVSSLMGEVGKGITAFKKGVREGGEEVDQAARAESTSREEAERREIERDRNLRDVTPTERPLERPVERPVQRPADYAADADRAVDPVRRDQDRV